MVEVEHWQWLQPFDGPDVLPSMQFEAGQYGPPVSGEFNSASVMLSCKGVAVGEAVETDAVGVETSVGAAARQIK